MSQIKSLQAVYLVLRLLLKRSTAGWLHWTGFTFTAMVYAVCWWSIKAALGEPAAAGLPLPTCPCTRLRQAEWRRRCAVEVAHHPIQQNHHSISGLLSRSSPSLGPHPWLPAPAPCPPFPAPRAAPAYNAAGELVYAGQDLHTGGVLSYFHDVVYVSIFVQLGGAFSDWFWLAFLAVPAYALYALLVHVALPYWNQPRLEDLPEGEAERRRREKRERQAARVQKFAGRR